MGGHRRRPGKAPLAPTVRGPRFLQTRVNARPDLSNGPGGSHFRPSGAAPPGTRSQTRVYAAALLTTLGALSRVGAAHIHLGRELYLVVISGIDAARSMLISRGADRTVASAGGGWGPRQRAVRRAANKLI